MTTIGSTAAFDALRFAEDVQRYRKRMGLSLRDFVRDREVGFNTVARVENCPSRAAGSASVRARPARATGPT